METLRILPNKSFDFINTGDPSATTNPEVALVTWLNATTGVTWVCTDNTTNANVWVAQRASTVEEDVLFQLGMVSTATLKAYDDSGNADGVLTGTNLKMDADKWVNSSDSGSTLIAIVPEIVGTLSTFSVFAWVDITTGSVQSIVAEYDYSANKRRWALRIQTTGEAIVYTSGDGTAITTTQSTATVLNKGVALIGFTYSAGAINVYVNDNAPVSASVETSLYSGATVNTSIFAIGTVATINSGLQDKCKGIKIYNKVLTQAEVLAIYKAGA